MLKPPASPPPVVAVDIPSGWHVEEGDVAGDGLRPQMLVSLTTPKRAAARFEGPHHYLGGRFVPPAIVVRAARFLLKLGCAPHVMLVEVSGGLVFVMMPIRRCLRKHPYLVACLMPPARLGCSRPHTQATCSMHDHLRWAPAWAMQTRRELIRLAC